MAKVRHCSRMHFPSLKIAKQLRGKKKNVNESIIYNIQHISHYLTCLHNFQTLETDQKLHMKKIYGTQKHNLHSLEEKIETVGEILLYMQVICLRQRQNSQSKQRDQFERRKKNQILQYIFIELQFNRDKYNDAHTSGEGQRKQEED